MKKLSIAIAVLSLFLAAPVWAVEYDLSDYNYSEDLGTLTINDLEHVNDGNGIAHDSSFEDGVTFNLSSSADYDAGITETRLSWDPDYASISDFTASLYPVEDGSKGSEIYSNTLGEDETVMTISEKLEVGDYLLELSGKPDGDSGHGQYTASMEASPVPAPAAAWVLGAGLLGLMGYRMNTQRKDQ